VKEISEILVDARLAGQLVEDVENEETTKVYLIVRDNLSILPRRDIELKLGDVLIMRMDNQ
jgi:voltage-gated potassium channel